MSDPTLAASPLPPSPPAPATVPKEVFDERVAGLTARLRRAEAERDEARSHAQSPPPPASPPTPPPGYVPASEVETRAAQLAAERTSQANVLAEFTNKIQATQVEGRKLFTDFDQKTADLQSLIDPNNSAAVNHYNSFLAAAMETGKGPQIVHKLGTNLNEALRVLRLPPMKMAIEVAKIAQELPAAATPQEQPGTVLPRPVVPVGGNGADTSAISPSDPERQHHLSTAEWMRRRSAEAPEEIGGRKRA